MSPATGRPGCTDAELADLEEPCCLGWGKGWHEYDCPDRA